MEGMIMLMRVILAGALLTLPVAAAAAPKKLTLEQRVQRMEDESEIRQILVKYGTYLDARDFASYASLFADDGEWVGGFGRFKGPNAIQAMLEERLGKAEPGWINKQGYHLLSNALIQLDGNKAHVTSKYLFLTKPEDQNRPVPLLAGRYEDDLVRVNGAWKIVKRVTNGIIPYRDGNGPTPPPPPGLREAFTGEGRQQ
jgi:3-phenylpropionate/cinnamic acid dioxygenase small subunit